MSQDPWEKWKLNSRFLTELDRWAAQNPENSLDRVLARVCDAIEQGKEFFEMIPDGSFPARGLVKGLAQLVKFGETIASANREVHGFAMEVVEWITDIRRAFSAGRNNWMKGHFTRTTWANLERIRAIIDEICQWAHARLLDKRWSFVVTWNKLHVQSAIETFRKRISDARAIFNESAIINQSRGIDAILHLIGIVTNDQRRIMETQERIEKMLLVIQATQTDQLNTILARLDVTDAEAAERRMATIIKKRHQYVQQMLSKHSVEDPTYITQDKPPCDEDTRVGVLAAISRWVWDVTPGPDSQNFFWLSGNPGCGKSAITASLAKYSEVKDILWAQFFINRNNPDTTNPNAYFPTIARQLAERSESVEHKLHDQLKTDGTLLNAVSSQQAARLFIDAVRVASGQDLEKPVVIVIDGLDETNRTHLRSTAEIFAQLFDALPDCPNVKVFISSRTDNDIQTPFAKAFLGNNRVKKLHLDTDHPSSIKDVTFYLRRHLAQIVLEHSLDWNNWPGEQGVDMLAQHASGLFIWAATAVKFFRQQIEDWGRERLPLLLDDLGQKGMMDLDALYGYIIVGTYKRQANDSHDSDWAFETFRRLVGAIVVLYEPLSLDNLGNILNLRQTPTSPVVDVIQFVKRLRTVLIPGFNAIHGRTVPRLHKSFYEYITSDRVDARFRIDVIASHRELSIRCLYQLPDVKSATSTFKMPLIFRYACKFWAQHWVQVSPTWSAILVDTAVISGLHDVESLLRCSSSRLLTTAPVTLTVTRSSIVAAVVGHSCAWDTSHGLVEGAVSLDVDRETTLPHRTPHYFKAVNHNLPRKHVPTRIKWRLHTSPVIGSMTHDGKHIFCATAYMSDSRPPVPRTRKIGVWNPYTDSKFTLKTFEEGLDTFPGSTFDNGYFAELRQHQIHIWHIGKYGSIAKVKSIPHAKRVTCLTLSPLGQTLAAGCFDGSIYFWNVADSKLLSPSVTIPAAGLVDRSKIMGIVFSTDGTKALSYSHEARDIFLWILVDGEFHQTLTFKGGSSSVLCSVAFSPDGIVALSGHEGGEICFWDVMSGELIGPPLKIHGHFEGVSVLQYSSDGQALISGNYRGDINLWDVETKQKITSAVVERDSRNSGISACFLSDGRICGSGPHGMKVFEIKGEHTHLKHLGSSPNALEHVLFSSTTIQTISLSSKGKIWLRFVGNEERKEVILETKGSFRPILFAFSPDGRRVSASSSNGVIRLWDAISGKLIASSKAGSAVSAFTSRKHQDRSIFFTSDNRLITVSEGTVSLWEATSGKLTRVPSPSPFPTSPAPFFHNNDYHLENTATYHGTQCIPSKHTGSELWAFIGDHVIRAQKDGTLFIARLDRTE